MTSVATDTSSTYDTYRFKVEFAYDGQGRVRLRRDYTWVGGMWYQNTETRHLYDGMLLIQERDGGNTPTVTYTRGRGLSGSLEGAGGIGGLLARSHGYSGGNWSSHNYYHADGNGNVTALANSGGTLQASYKYDPYGRYLSGGGALASANVMRFSSKPWMGFNGSTTSGLYYYGYRFYDPYLQRWVNRDPIGEVGWLELRVGGKLLSATMEDLYPMAANNPINIVDLFGLRKWCGTCEFGGAGWAIALQGIICDLTAPCAHGKARESIHVRAVFLAVSAGLPDVPGVTAIKFRTCFEVPDGFDAESSFSGAARFVSGTGAIGRGGSVGKVVLGYAESEGWTSVSGFDLGAGFGSGFSWLENHTNCDCK